MSGAEDTPNGRPKRNIMRTKATEQHDQEMAEKKARQDNKTRKNNIKAQREALNARRNNSVSPSPPPATARAVLEIEIPTSRRKSATNEKQTSAEPPLSSSERLAPQDSPAPKGRAPTKAPTKAFQPVESQSHARGAAPNTKKGPAQSQSHARGAVSTTKNSNDSSRAKSKGGPDPTLRYKLIADIAKRDKRHDHTEYDMKTLQMIWDNKPKEDSLTKGNRYKEISVLGTTDIDEPPSGAAAPRKIKPVPKTAPSNNGEHTSRGGGDLYGRRASNVSTASVRSATPISVSASRHSTPVGPVQVSSKVFRPTARTSGPWPNMQTASGYASGYATSRSASPFDRSDHDFASDFDTSFVEEIGAITFESSNKNGKKPRRSNYTGTVLEILDATYEDVSAHLVTTGFFIGMKPFEELVARSWKLAARDIGVDPNTPKYRLEEGHSKVTRFRMTSFQGRIKDAIVAQMEKGYGLGEKTKADIIEWATKSVPHQFHTKPGSKEGKGQYQHPFIQTAINHAFFDVKTKSTPIGVTHSSAFGPKEGMPLPAVALTCAVIHWSIEQFKSGKTNVDAPMQAKAVEKLYDLHLGNLIQFEAINEELADVMRKKWFIAAVKHSKAPVSKSNKPGTPQILSAIILPDKPTEKERLAVSSELQRLYQHEQGDADNSYEADGDVDEPDQSDEPDDAGDSDADGSRHGRTPRKSNKAAHSNNHRVKGWGEEAEEGEEDEEDEGSAGGKRWEGGEGEEDDDEDTHGAGGWGGEGEEAEAEGEGEGDSDGSRYKPVVKASEAGRARVDPANDKEASLVSRHSPRKATQSGGKSQKAARTSGGPMDNTRSATRSHADDAEVDAAHPSKSSPSKVHKRRRSRIDEPGSEEDVTPEVENKRMRKGKGHT